MGPDPLGLASPVGELAVQSRHRSAGYGLGLAPERLPAPLPVEVSDQPGRPPEARSQPFAVSSGAWLARTPPGAAAASAQNSPSSATTSPNSPSRSTCAACLPRPSPRRVSLLLTPIRLVNILKSSGPGPDFDDGFYRHADVLILTGPPRRPLRTPALVLENLALRHQLAVHPGPAPRPRCALPTACLWVVLRQPTCSL